MKTYGPYYAMISMQAYFCLYEELCLLKRSSWCRH